jgi:DNA-directed RNA polymerase
LGIAPPDVGNIRLPAICGEEYMSKAIKVRHGVASHENKKVAGVVRDMSEERFVINEFVLGLVKKYPPDLRKAGEHQAKYLYDKTTSTAEYLLGKSFRFPHFLDSRSRMYPDTNCGVTVQGADYEKALLLPVYSEPLTPAGVEHLIKAAWGYSEIDWDMSTMIRHARDPEAHRSVWETADKPYSYMSCAKLLEMYDTAPEAPLPAFRPLDGRCSGLQHWSAVCRSRAITAHLGMEPDEHPLDIYEKVALDWENSLPDSQKVYATRKAAKIPVMTWGYNATRMTSMEYLDSLYGSKSQWDRKKKAFVVYEKGLDRATAGKLGCDLYDQLNVTLAELTEAVEWVSDCATIISEDGNPDIHWPTPDGFECKQRKVVGVEVVVKVILSNGEDFRVGLRDYTVQKPAHGKHRSAIAPNVIHSLDATHLRMVARKLAALGLPMIFVHDSFATHVNYTDTLYKIIVDTFSELYSVNWLQELHRYWTERYNVVLSDPPALGDWEPEKIKLLDKFFL